MGRDVGPDRAEIVLPALLVVQATAASTLLRGIERVVSLVAGVAPATGFVSVVSGVRRTRAASRSTGVCGRQPVTGLH